jgi:hypothetical protein
MWPNGNAHRRSGDGAHLILRSGGAGKGAHRATTTVAFIMMKGVAGKEDRGVWQRPRDKAERGGLDPRRQAADSDPESACAGGEGFE